MCLNLDTKVLEVWNCVDNFWEEILTFENIEHLFKDNKLDLYPIEEERFDALIHEVEDITKEFLTNEEDILQRKALSVVVYCVKELLSSLDAT